VIFWRKVYSIFNLRYKEDIKKYGDPSDSERKVVAATSLPHWQVVLQAHAKKVEIVAAGSNGGRKSKKRAAPDAWAFGDGQSYICLLLALQSIIMSDKFELFLWLSNGQPRNPSWNYIVGQLLCLKVPLMSAVR
jgi:hypothetical protein